jgi:hypothetical protein
MALWQSLVELTDITALKAFNPAVDGDKRLIKSPSSIITIPPSWYRYDISADYTENLPGIVTPNSGVGRWIMIPQPLILSFNPPSGIPELANIRWLKIDEELEWVSRQINSNLQWVSNSSQSDQLFNLTSTILTTNGTVTQGCNKLEVFCLSGTANFSGIPLSADPLARIKGFKFPALSNEEVYNSFSYTVSGQLLIIESRISVNLTSPIVVSTTATLFNSATSGNTPPNSKWISALINQGTAIFAGIPLSLDGISGYELEYQQGKLYNAITYSVDSTSELILIVAF